MINVEEIKKDFPIFEREINNSPLVYLDSGATSQKPQQVLEAMNDIYTKSNANVHRGTYVLSSETTGKYEDVVTWEGFKEGGCVQPNEENMQTYKPNVTIIIA